MPVVSAPPRGQKRTGNGQSVKIGKMTARTQRDRRAIDDKTDRVMERIVYGTVSKEILMTEKVDGLLVRDHIKAWFGEGAKRVSDKRVHKLLGKVTAAANPLCKIEGADTGDELSDELLDCLTKATTDDNKNRDTEPLRLYLSYGAAMNKTET